MRKRPPYAKDDLIGILIQHNKILKNALSRLRLRRKQDMMTNELNVSTFNALSNENQKLKDHIASLQSALQAANEERAEAGRNYTNEVEQLTLQNMWAKNRYVKEKAEDYAHKQEVLDALDDALKILEGERNILSSALAGECLQRKIDASPDARRRIAELRAVHAYHSPPDVQEQQVEEPPARSENTVDVCGACGTISEICRCPE